MEFCDMFTASPTKIRLDGGSLVKELEFYYSGEQDCAPGFEWGPMVRDHYVLHVIFSGNGRFRSEDRETALGAGGFFLIRPGAKTWYQADRERPWRYRWVGFNGLRAGELLRAAGVDPELPAGNGIADLSEAEECFQRFAAAERMTSPAKEFSRVAALYRLLALLAAALPEKGEKDQTDDLRAEYIRRVMTLVERRYADETLHVADLAAAAGVNRHYLARIFHEYLNTSPSGYLTACRMRKAAELLTGSRDLSVKETAFSVGYRDPLFFSRMFRRFHGMTATEFRRRSRG